MILEKKQLINLVISTIIKKFKDSQSIKSIDTSKIFNIDIINNMLDSWTNIKNNDEFLIKHQYIG